MPERNFAILVKEVITYNQLEQYFTGMDAVAEINSHYDLQPDIETIERDFKSAGGLKLSHAQRRMLTVLVSLWNDRVADSIFNESLGSLAKTVQSMDRNNRELLAELIVTYPGWG
ncbi:hypothetical protein [Sneathiella sp.]|uniref:hypothetical protein n=1 Tax=Sneathiella sp. TaxID=1964365 RepID=UPI003563C24F